jgi:5-methylcytosine-specific restriction protein A
LLLALDLYLREGLLDDRHPDVIELSHTLNQLSASSIHPDAERFRNPNGVAMKLANFASLDPHYGGVALARGSRGDLEVWREFLTDRDRLKQEAERVRLQAATSTQSRSQNQMPSRYWAFNANPRVYNIEQAVRILEIDTWTTKGKPIHIGDKVIIWKSLGGPRRRRGIVALGEVITEPEVRVDADNPFWMGPGLGSMPEPRIEVRYVVPPRLPLWYGDADVPVLSELTVNGGQGTVFKVQSLM